MSKKLKYIGFGIVLVFGIYFSFQNLTNKKNNEVKELKIGALIPKTGGKVSIFGKWMREGMELGNESFNNDNPKYAGALKLDYEDSEFDVKKGLSAFIRLRDINNVDVFISTMTNVSVPILEKMPTSKPILLQDVTFPNVTEYGKNVFRHFVSSETEAELLSQFIEVDLGIKSCALIYQNDETGQGAKNVFDKSLSNKGIIFDSYAISKDDIMANKSVINKVIESNPECIIIFAYSVPWITSMKTIKELGYNKTILTNTAMYIDPWRKAIGNASENVVFTHPEIDTTTYKGKVFYNKYFEKHNERPSLEAAYGYDLINIIGNAYILSEQNKTSFETELYKLKAFEGAFGRILIPEDRDIITQIHISRIKNGEMLKSN